MSLAESVSSPSQVARRCYARRKLDGLSYVEFGPDNGAILIDLGEGGLGFQSVLPVSMSETLLFKFKFPGENNYVEGFGEITWMNESGKGGGLRFIEVADETRTKIREWTGGVSEGGGSNGNNAEPHAAAEEPNEAAKGNPDRLTSRAATEATDQPEPPAKISEELATKESAQPPSPSADKTSDSVEPVRQAAEADRQTPEIKNAEVSIPEFTIEVAPSSDVPALQEDSAPPASPFVAATVEHKAEAQQQPATRSRAKSRAVEVPPASPAAALAAADVRISAPVHMRRVSATAKANAENPNFDRQAAPAEREAPLGSHTQAARHTTARRNVLTTDADELHARATLASQVLRITIGVAAGAAVVLILFLIVPSLRTRVEATAGRASVLNSAGAPAFEVEVADINSRRWILRSGGEAASPFSTAASRRDTENSASANSNRKESAKASGSEEAGDSASTTTTKSKLSKPSELALSRPRAGQQRTASAQPVAPSIFDGITPPVGAVSDRLAAGGPEAPGIVQPDPQGVRTTALQSAVLVQRVAPVYPPNAIESRVQGDVQVSATVGKDGVPKALKVTSGDLRLVPAALAAIRQWHYRPATLGGEPIETQIVITVSFQLK